ncbi:alpha/beta hydrolase family protein [Roseiconus nitratireducens]|uniref:alpha/beta hydrolase family protein n=1 Tax=Roseiconus nitratireducens TaxID=2605748 RepID=UPI0013758D59|nr:acetylxylan esterase [Roseiconus nitratireducens]
MATCSATETSPWDLNAWHQVPPVQWLDDSSPVRSLLFESVPYEGHKTQVFAFYATPGSVSGDPSKDVNLPAVVLLHGGGGTAFAEWVNLWARRGYAAIAMDLCGNRPEAPHYAAPTGELLTTAMVPRQRLEFGGPAEGPVGKFQNVGGDVTDDWQYHAVAAGMLAHSLIRSFPEVDGERTAVTGISWGGYLTCLMASLDDRFKAAVPVYGCGFLSDGESVQRNQIDALPPERRAQWIRDYDPSAWLPRCHTPIFFVNGTNDKHYPLRSYQRTYSLVPGPRQLRIEVGMKHGHPPGWAPKEIGLFVNHYLRGTPSLPKFGPLVTRDRIATASIQSPVPIRRAQLHFTIDGGTLVDRTWTSVPAACDGSEVSAAVPEAAQIWMLSVTDSRDAMVSTGVSFAPRAD